MKRLQKINTIAFAAMIIVNSLANIIPFGGNTTGQVSEAYPNLFTPAPITFAIWGAIYLLLGGFVLYQWGVLDNEGHSEKLREKIDYWFAASCVLNIAWIFAWHSRAISYSLLCMGLLLFSLIQIEKAIAERQGSFLTKILAYAGFDLYFGWIIAATIANVSVFLVSIGWSGWGFTDEFWTMVVLLVGAAIGCAVVLVNRRWLSGAAIMWAYGGIILRHFTDASLSRNYIFVIAAAFTGIVAILCAIALSAMGSLYRYHPMGGASGNVTYK